MADWGNLPADLLYSIYRFLPRRDLMSCNFVCLNWSYSLDYVKLWQTYIVHIDVDLLEPSTTLFLRQYCQYVRCLEIGWAVSQSRSPRWAPSRYKELTKRTARLLTILHDEHIQLTKFRMFNWFDVIPCKKIMYHIRRLLQSQTNLRTIALDSTNLYTDNYIRMLTCCMNSKESVRSLDVRNCHHSAGALDTIYLQNFVQQLTNLQSFQLDYHTLSCGMIKSIVAGNAQLSSLKIVIKGNVAYKMIKECEWELLRNTFPYLRVTVFIRNGHYSILKQYLDDLIPLVCLSMSLSQVPDHFDKDQIIKENESDCSSEFEENSEYTIRKALNYLILNYSNTLEHLELQVNNKTVDHYELIDDLVILLLRRCLKLKTFVFKGFLHDPQVFTRAYENHQYLEEPRCSIVDDCKHLQIVVVTDSNRLRHYTMTAL